MAIPNAPRHTLPTQLSSISSYLKAVSVILCIIVIPHESQESNVNRSQTELERFKMKAEVLPKAAENLECKNKEIH